MVKGRCRWRVTSAWQIVSFSFSTLFRKASAAFLPIGQSHNKQGYENKNRLVQKKHSPSDTKLPHSIRHQNHSF